eukprot:Hpha_TRINITY_DN15524_c3_g3::TRINITY_DN15524_c3_g3_i1::g.107908::m.107908/K02320/POLA1; DNA polymerase alpha subunit A
MPPFTNELDDESSHSDHESTEEVVRLPRPDQITAAAAEERKRKREELREEKKQEKVARKHQLERERELARQEKLQKTREPKRETGQAVLQFAQKQRQREAETPAELRGVEMPEAQPETQDVESLLREREGLSGAADEVDALIGGEDDVEDIFFTSLTETATEAPPPVEVPPPVQAPPAAAAPAAMPAPSQPRAQPQTQPQRTPADGTASKRNFTVRSREGESVQSGPAESFASGPAPAQAAAMPDAGAVGAGGMQFFYLDAREDPQQPGNVLLFGKVLTRTGHVSACVRVCGLPRQVFFLPLTHRENASGEKEEVTLLEAQKEILKLCRDKGIQQRRVKPVKRWYGFEETGVPRDVAQWLKLSYPARGGPLGLTAGQATSVQRQLNTCSHAFGDGRSFLEMLLLKRRIMGPCWITINEFTPVQQGLRLTHCRMEFEVPSYKKRYLAVTPQQLPPPPLVVMAVGLFTHLTTNQRGLHQNEVVAASCVTWRNVNCDGLSPPEKPSRLAGVRGEQLLPHQIQRAMASAGLPGNVCCFNSERQLLLEFLRWLREEDPDVLVGHSFMSFDVDVLLHRMSALKIAEWSYLGRLHRTLDRMPKLQAGAGGAGAATWDEQNSLAGRLVADSYMLSREYHRTQNYKLRALSAEFGLRGVRGNALTEATVDLPVIQNVPAALSTPEGAAEIVARCDDKAMLSMRVLERLQIIPLTKRLTCIAGNTWQRTLSSARAERIEYLLLHKFHNCKYILPDRQTAASKRAGKRASAGPEEELDDGKRRAKYSGGMVLEPKRGLYSDYVVLLDFNSLYPSLMQEYLVCPTTVTRPTGDEDAEVPEDCMLVCTACQGKVQKDSCKLLSSCPHRCVLPKSIRELVLERRELKRQLANAPPGKKEQLDVSQKALKLTANSIYGCLGFEMSRFFAQPLAALITRKGRQALEQTVSLVGNMKLGAGTEALQVIYGDTDSVMLSTGILRGGPEALRKAVGLAHRVKEQVNRQYTMLEIDVDGVFQSLLLVRKKKYAAVVVDDWQGAGTRCRLEAKGLDLVRRDWCGLSAMVQDSMLRLLLSGQEQETILEGVLALLAEASRRIRCEEGAEPVPLEQYIIRKSITKPLVDYKDADNQPHVTVARRMQQKNVQVQRGDIIPYVVCRRTEDQGEKDKVSKRAYHPEEVEADEKLLVDAEWYLAVQIHPPAARLCEHIEGLGSRALASCLGIEGSQFVTHSAPERSSTHHNETYNTTVRRASAAERFPHHQEVVMQCSSCTTPIPCDMAACYGEVAKAIVEKAEKGEQLVVTGAERQHLVKCKACQRPVKIPKLFNSLVRSVRRLLHQYYFRGVADDGSKPEHREGFVRSQVQYLSARFGNEREINNEVQAALPEKGSQALEEQLRKWQRQSGVCRGQPKVVGHLLREFIETSYADDNGKEPSVGMQPLATYTSNLLSSCARTHVNLGFLSGLGTGPL